MVTIATLWYRYQLSLRRPKVVVWRQLGGSAPMGKEGWPLSALHT